MINEFDMSDAIERVTSLMYANKMSTEGKGLDPLATQTKFVINCPSIACITGTMPSLLG